MPYPSKTLPKPQNAQNCSYACMKLLKSPNRIRSIDSGAYEVCKRYKAALGFPPAQNFALAEGASALGKKVAEATVLW